MRKVNDYYFINEDFIFSYHTCMCLLIDQHVQKQVPLVCPWRQRFLPLQQRCVFGSVLAFRKNLQQHCGLHRIHSNVQYKS